MIDEKMMAWAHDARLINLSEGVLFPMLQKAREEAVQAMCSKFRAGNHDLLTEVARVVAYDDFILKLRAVQQKGNKAQEVISNDNR